MYELIGINRNLYQNFVTELARVYKEHNQPYVIISFAVKKACHRLIPHALQIEIDIFVAKLLKPLYDQLKYKVKRRNFKNDDEMYKLYSDIYNNIQDNTSNFYTDEEKEKINEIYELFYDLKEYSNITEIRWKTYITNYIQIIHIAELHTKYMEILIEKEANKKEAKKNISISTNSNKSPKDRTKFLNTYIQLFKLNPNVDEEVANHMELLSKMFTTIPRVAKRFTSQIKDVSCQSQSSFLTAVDEVDSFFDADSRVESNDIVISFIAYIFSTYNLTSGFKVPKTKLLKFSNELAKLIFPDHAHLVDKLVTEENVRNPIRERAMIIDLKLLEFTDNRLKIKRTKEEIRTAEIYFKIVTDTLRKS